MNENFKNLLNIASESDLPVLLTGESGTGKEVAARKLHSGSFRNGAFVAVNCGAISAGLAESLFCGHVRGAFTGASNEQLGFVRAANGGTLFLDEVAELSLETQKTLLRTLQEKTVTPIGSQREISVDFRLICATHKDLQALMKKGYFREDLYFRLSTFPIKLPPLRDRDDLRSIAKSIWKESEPLSEHNLRILEDYHWPGNIRQLKNVLERFALFKKYNYDLEMVLKAELNAFSANEPPAPKYKPNIAEIKEELRKFNGNKARTAKKF